jgi:hypothetical protein
MEGILPVNSLPKTNVFGSLGVLGLVVLEILSFLGSMSTGFVPDAASGWML